MPSNYKCFPHKDSPSIDKIVDEQLAKLKGFKGGKNPSSQWLTKKAPVNQATNPEYHPHKGQEDQ